MGFISKGSSAIAHCKAASASILVCSGNKSRKIPESVITTSIRARPSCSSEIRSAPHKRPLASNRGFAPISESACAIGPPLDLILSDPQSTNATVLGQPLMRAQQLCRLLRAILHRKSRRHPEGIKGVDIPACRQNIWRADDIAARNRLDKLAI